MSDITIVGARRTASGALAYFIAALDGGGSAAPERLVERVLLLIFFVVALAFIALAFFDPAGLVFMPVLGGLLKAERMAITLETEITEGTDPTPAAATDAILAKDVELFPLEQLYDDRNLVTPFMGSQNGQIVAGSYVRINFKVEIAGGGAAGTVPKYGPALTACALSETINAGVSVVYAPVSSAEKSCTIYLYEDGRLHKALGCHGDVDWVLEAGKIPYMQFRFVGLYAAVTDAAIITPTITAFQKPVAVNLANTTPFTLHAYAGKFRSMTLRLGNDVRYRNLPNSEAVRWVGRKPTASFVLEEELIAAKDWFTIARAGTLGALTCTHGTVAGNKATMAAANVQLTNPRQTSEDSVLMIQLDGLPTQTSAGNDELTYTAL